MADITDYNSFDWESWKPEEEATLLFTFDDAGRVLLIHKKGGLGKGKINGPGGRLEPGETPMEAAIRETNEEVGINIEKAEFCGKLMFHFTDGYELLGHVFKSHEWSGVPVETDEALPEWFDITKIPYERMWEDDRYWFPLMLEGVVFTGKFIFNGDDMLWRSIEVGSGEESVKCR
ncbi:MAG: 8-oxo-dGTP diphosphatase [Lentisphaerae bacterium]|jgi:8-oxo-dGTP diphosphatase|nr:8-oxo-dGTP diphosphatase [Lentisphaerota bacterium]